MCNFTVPLRNTRFTEERDFWFLSHCLQHLVPSHVGNAEKTNSFLGNRCANQSPVGNFSRIFHSSSFTAPKTTPACTHARSSAHGSTAGDCGTETDCAHPRRNGDVDVATPTRLFRRRLHVTGILDDDVHKIRSKIALTAVPTDPGIPIQRSRSSWSFNKQVMLGSGWLTWVSWHPPIRRTGRVARYADDPASTSKADRTAATIHLISTGQMHIRPGARYYSISWNVEEHLHEAGSVPKCGKASADRIRHSSDSDDRLGETPTPIPPPFHQSTWKPADSWRAEISKYIWWRPAWCHMTCS